MNCANCKYNDGTVYTSLPPKYKCTITDEFHNAYGDCNVDLVPLRTGTWIDVMTEDWCTFDECKCSVCGTVECFNKGWKKFSYCPNCGARMEDEP